MGCVTRRMNVHGIVQGVGFRPAVARHAAARKVTGFVCNHGSYVEVVAQGAPVRVEAFLGDVIGRAPERAEIVRHEVQELEGGMTYEDFSIAESADDDLREIFIPPDIAICDDCARELMDPCDRRYLHPFINCTQCGPRLTILESLPYDRERTSMGRFALCDACDREYHDPASRRFDAQPVCCNDCGPVVYLADAPDVRGPAALTRAREVLAGGGIVAVKGIGGFHLACDATSEQAVARLRELKRRPAKPFAVMARDLDAARRECVLGAEAERLLRGHRRPIVLVERRRDGTLAPNVAPGNPNVGVMVPYAPVQLLLFSYPDGLAVPDVLVMTSGNVSGAPICRDDAEALDQIGAFADCILSHDREIRTRADDSVVDLFEGRPYMVRRSRGYSPLPVAFEGLPAEGRVLAVGGELKNTFCLGTGDLLYPSSYIGDLADRRSVAALEETIGRYEGFLAMRPQAIACDLHPGYNSTRVAEELAARDGVEVVRVQHHYAHVLSCMAENGARGPVLGIALDGTGYGPDETIWGGELLVADLDGYERAAHIAPFPHTGGDAASREGWRIATSMLVAYDGVRDAGGRARGDRDARGARDARDVRDARGARETALALGLAEKPAVAAQVAATERGLNTVTSTSCGRLFDAVAAVLGLCRASSFEGEAACALQFAAERAERERPGAYVSWEGATPAWREGAGGEALVVATDALFSQVVSSRLAGEDADVLALAFHRELARMLCVCASRVRERHGVATAALTGGCFQNRLLLRLVAEGLRAQGFSVLTHGLIAPNDGGIALGQAVYALHNMGRETTCGGGSEPRQQERGV